MTLSARSTATDPNIDSRRAWALAFTLALAVVVSYLDRGIISVLVPSLKVSLGFNDTQVSLLQGISFSLFFAIASLPLGALVDRVNRRNIIILGITIWSAMTMLCGTAGSFWELFAYRAGVGIGEACLMPAAYSMIADSFQSAQRGRPMSILTIAATLGGASSTVVGGALLTLWSNSAQVTLPIAGSVEAWRAVFLIAGIPGLALLPVLLAIREPQRTLLPVPGEPAAGAAHDGRSFAAFFLAEWRLLIPMYLAFASVFFLSYAIVLWSPTVLVRTYGYAPGHAGLTTGPVQMAGSFIGALSAGVLGDRMVGRGMRYGRLRLWGPGLAACALAVALLLTPYVVVHLIGLFIVIVASGLLLATSYPALYDAIPASMKGRSVAAYLFVANIIGLGGGSAAVGLLTDHVYRSDALVNRSVATAAGIGVALSAAMALLARSRYEAARLSPR